MNKYITAMFPYPSGDGLHVGHYYNYAIVDSYCRWMKHKGMDVFQPFGYDAFGLPAENYARKVGRDPRSVTEENIDKFRQQMTHMNTCFDECLVTSDASYIKWTQWVFMLLHKRGLAYKKVAPVNWCAGCQTVLANEQAANGTCERCNTAVQIKNLNQWFFKITDYKERLIKNLDWIDYPEKTVKQQRAWLEHLHDWCVSRQRSWGCPIPIDGETDTLDTFVDSSFYYLRYCTQSDDEFLPIKDYRQVDVYVGGPEHACMHLIYARFIHMVLFDAGIVPVEEPFKQVVHQGMITKDGHKMSKSRGNVVRPDDYDSDELRMYLMFMGPYAEGGDWSDQHIVGVSRFIKRFKAWTNQEGDGVCLNNSIQKLSDKIDQNIHRWKFNLVVSSWMEFYNQHKNSIPTKENKKAIIDLLEIIAPQTAQEIR